MTYVYPPEALKRRGGRIHPSERTLLVFASLGVVLSLVLSVLM